MDQNWYAREHRPMVGQKPM